ncbi:serine/threonine-protein kinase [Actinomadura opuntiae]|uniref:serine/threonine-protein kinase n=1 Tax=Actinomadura sp. OS1-43 TaxID=604315 RepID=UPI00255A78B4|nr:serine/threonine protein kinase [Actinomadura sp. OS1-43]MDL4814599.1 protein kinase [Actinomadura sp. OS1-43]
MEVGALRSGDPERLGRYALVGRVGEGGQGAVFLGADEDGRQVAIKLLHSELTSDDKARARFLRELEVAKRVAPFCTAQVLDADVDGDRPYIVSEYVPGPSLNQLVTQDGPVRGAALDRLAVGTATALSAIHQAEIIHRDFKPHNVLIGPDGPRVIDFGVARAISGSTTLTSRVIGTPSYMAPEQISGDDVGTAADVFCWAATLVFAATGEPPFGQDTIPAVINRILHEEPDLGDMSGPLHALVVDCLAKDPARRPPARQVLMRLLGHEEAPVVAAPASNTDETAMLEAGSVLAAELADDDFPPARPADAYEPDAYEPDAYESAAYEQAAYEQAAHEPEPFDPSGTEPGRLPTPAEWAAENTADTLPPDRAPAAGGGGIAALRRSFAGSSRSAMLAGAAALFVAIVVVSAVLALGSGHKGKAGEKVGDPSRAPQPSDTAPSLSVPTTSAPTQEATEPSYTSSPTTGETATDSPAPTDSPSVTPSTPDDPGPTHTTESPDPTPTTSPKPTDPDTPTDPPPGSPAAAG